MLLVVKLGYAALSASACVTLCVHPHLHAYSRLCLSDQGVKSSLCDYLSSLSSDSSFSFLHQTQSKAFTARTRVESASVQAGLLRANTTKTHPSALYHPATESRERWHEEVAVCVCLPLAM